MAIAPNLNILANPICVRCARARLRWKHMLSWGLIVLTLTSFICVVVYETQTQRELGTEAQAAKSLLFPLFIIQAVILMFLGTGSVASGLARERENRLLDYHRMTPMSPTAKIMGYLFGLPVREYFLFALTLPFVLFAMLKSGYSWWRLAEFYSVFFSSVWLYHMTGMVAGMATSRPRFAAAMAQGMVVALYFVLPRLGLVGFRFFEHLTMLPTFTRLVFEEAIGRQWYDDPSFDPNRFNDVPFFNWDVSATGFTLLVQGFLLAFMFIVVYRKWKEERAHPLSKVGAAIMFAGTTAFLVGNVWPLIDRPGAMVEFMLAFDPRARVREIDYAPAMILMGVMFAFSIISGLIALFVINIITPSRHTAMAGWRLARKLGRASPGLNSDASSSLPATVAMIACLTAANITLIWLAWRSGQFFMTMPPVSTWLPPLLLGAAVFLFVQAVRERFSARVFLVGTFILWMVPFFVTIILMAAFSKWTAGTYIGLPFPPLSQALATFRFFDAAEVVNERRMWGGPTPILNDIPVMVWLGTGLYVSLAGVMQVELWRWRRGMLELDSAGAAAAGVDVGSVAAIAAPEGAAQAV